MPVKINPISAPLQVVTDKTIVCDHLFADIINLDTSDRQKTKATITQTPYAIVDGVPVFSTETKQKTTRDLVAAMANIPSIGIAMQAVFTALEDWATWENNRQTDLDKATEVLNSTIESESKALTARNDAFAQRTDKDDPNWINADEAWKKAQQETQIAKANVEIAKAAVADPADPAL